MSRDLYFEMRTYGAGVSFLSGHYLQGGQLKVSNSGTDCIFLVVDFQDNLQGPNCWDRHATLAWSENTRSQFRTWRLGE